MESAFVVLVPANQVEGREERTPHLKSYRSVTCMRQLQCEKTDKGKCDAGLTKPQKQSKQSITQKGASKLEIKNRE